VVSAIGPSAYGSTSSGNSSVAALQGRIRQDQVQLNDWTTCVSASTPKGQSAIQKLSGEISADKEQITRTLQAQSSASASSPSATGVHSLDVWV
jgi:hypothetical protein